MHDLDQIRHQIESDIEARLQLTSVHSSALVEAMKYSVCGTAKRVRAVLVCATAVGFGEEIHRALSPAAAIELVHAYSLVHDDLPDMDDSDTRRGKPSCHKQYGSTIAILAGDALQAMAFSTILEAAQLTVQQRMDCATVLANASGWRNMVGGQAMDMELMHGAIHNLAQLFTMHEGKTGALFRAALEMGAIVAGFSRESEQFATMSRVGTKIGIAFQLTDDFLDATAGVEQLGKPAGADSLAGKKSAVAFLGTEETRSRAIQYLDKAVEILNSIDGDMTLVQRLAEDCVHRQR